MDDAESEIEETLAMKGAFTTILGLIVLMIASIGVLNLMLMAVFEHTRRRWVCCLRWA